MANKVEKNSGLAGITVLMNQSVLDPKVDLQKAEEKILHGGSDKISNKSKNSGKSKRSDIDNIYKLAKDLDIKIDGLGPDNVSRTSRTTKPLVNKLNLDSSDSDSSDDRKSSRHSIKEDKRSSRHSIKEDKRSSRHSIKEDKRSSRHSRISTSTISTKPNIYKTTSGAGHSGAISTPTPPPYDSKRQHINGVINNIRHENKNTFSTDIERLEDQKASKIEQIASIKLALAEEGIDTTMINTPLMNSPIEEIDSTLNLLLLKNNRYRYSSLAEEVISAGAEVLESVFDGTRHVPIFNVTPDYTGYSSTVNVKLHRLRFETSQVVGDIVEKHNVSPFSRIIMELIPGFLLYPRVRSKQKITTGQKKLTNNNSSKSYSSIRSKLEPHTSQNEFDMMNNI